MKKPRRTGRRGSSQQRELVADDYVQNASGAIADQQIFAADTHPMRAESWTRQTETAPIIDHYEAAILRSEMVTAYPAVRAGDVAHDVIVAGAGHGAPISRVRSACAEQGAGGQGGGDHGFQGLHSDVLSSFPSGAMAPREIHTTSLVVTRENEGLALNSA